MENLPDSDFTPREVLTPLELSEIYSSDKKRRAIDLVPLPSGSVAVFDHQNGSLLGKWAIAKEDYDMLVALADSQESNIRRVEQLYLDALNGGEPSSSTLARDLKAATRPHAVRIPVAERGIDL